MKNVIYLDDQQKAMWLEAGQVFPGELAQVMHRALQDLPQDHCPEDVYALYRDDAPEAFDALAALEGRGIERRHIYVEPRGERDLLHIDITLLDLIAQSIALLIDVLTSIFGSSPPVSPPAHINRPGRAPSWQRQLRIRHDAGGYEP